MNKRFVLLISLWSVLLITSTGTSYAQLLLNNPDDPITTAQTVWQQILDKEGQAVLDQCTPQVKQGITAQQINALVDTFETQMGQYQSNDSWKSSQKAGYTIVTALLHFEKGDFRFTCSTNLNKQIVGFFFKPVTQKIVRATSNDTFLEKKIAVGKSPYKLAGLLTLPKNKQASHPCVILVHGSGAHNMNEQIGPNKPFEDLAHNLAQQGIASIRYNKRTYEHAQKMTSEITIYEATIDDAIAAVKLAQNTAPINPKQVYVLGHSLGGMCLPRITKGANKTCTQPVAGGIFMAANASPLEDLILWQLSKQMPATEIEQLKKSVANVKKIHTTDFDSTLPLPLNIPPAFWKSIVGYNQVNEAAACPHPMLLLFGERDIQVPISEMALWKKGLQNKINEKQVRFISYPTLSHLLMPAGNPPGPKDYEKKAHISPKVIDDIANWIKKH